MQVGEKINFNKYKWLVLDIKDGKALIITEGIIEHHRYHDAYKEITWAECSLRKYLNGEFFERFSVADQSKIIPAINKNHDNQWFGTKGGEDTEDKIFLLSLEEVACKYFGDSSSKLYNPGKNQRYWYERKDENNSRRIAVNNKEKWYYWWWLRSPGRNGKKAVYMFPDGNIGIHGNNIFIGNVAEGECRGGVRPALWMKLN